MWITKPGISGILTLVCVYCSSCAAVKLDSYTPRGKATDHQAASLAKASRQAENPGPSELGSNAPQKTVAPSLKQNDGPVEITVPEAILLSLENNSSLRE